jgi:ankyrin repeat protein
MSTKFQSLKEGRSIQLDQTPSKEGEGYTYGFMKVTLKMLIQLLVLPPVFSTASALFLAGCQPFQKDYSAELVNAAARSTNEVLSLLKKGADVNARSKRHFGWTPLISAVYSQKEEVVDLLLSCGANVDISDSRGETPLYWAIIMWSDNTNVIRKLVQSGANPRIKNRYGSDSFDAAHSEANSEELLAIVRSAHPKKRLERKPGD